MAGRGGSSPTAPTEDLAGPLCPIGFVALALEFLSSWRRMVPRQSGSKGYALGARNACGVPPPGKFEAPLPRGPDTFGRHRGGRHPLDGGNETLVQIRQSICGQSVLLPAPGALQKSSERRGCLGLHFFRGGAPLRGSGA
ncbi:hypothetical protein TraAM80_09769 [Trypanosoma rangeli]|uniref:Uncharacterized protein n=1 Tax=Trypanosoma rangeli TaxID=5698 RepID=A0A3R7N5Q8_TRYRA|nr:uncharacterized protein TraAM80_09769 [Trypanosoma rangeli]RNE96954.1 hypothetical protein TraAM80_09769 [Trypanosoma rangeli]|eukprot:RNE96954.1 hypothetical protein TraAM80_09769 [Trypanosoma rangeli]